MGSHKCDDPSFYQTGRHMGPLRNPFDCHQCVCDAILAGFGDESSVLRSLRADSGIGTTLASPHSNSEFESDTDKQRMITYLEQTHEHIQRLPFKNRNATVQELLEETRQSDSFMNRLGT
tara:strand:- start:3427 stop:3786 length:360 start_codon:yes stop_codon:yes gene_type:complete